MVCRGCNQEGHIVHDCRNCFTCGQSGHRKSVCPMGAGQVGQVTPNQTYRLLPPSAQSVQSQSAQSQQRPLRMPQAQGRAFALVRPDVDVSNAVVEGVVTMFSSYAWILFDTGSTHSFSYCIICFIAGASRGAHELHVECCVTPGWRGRCK